jgi:hypothetical protein
LLYYVGLYIWRCCNDIIFNKTKYSSFMHTIFKGTYWLRFSSQLQHDASTKELLQWTSSSLEVASLDNANLG